MPAVAELGALLDRLRRGEMPALVLDDVDALVAWLCGKGSREAGPDDDPLPVPEHDPVLLQMVFYRLDATLFNGGELNLKAAGLDAGQSDKQRKARFRRLAGAFHPDRHPVLADWLTARSQIVLQAYGRFKHQHGEPPPVDPVPPWPGAPEAPRHMRPKGARRHSRRRLRGLLLRLRQRFGHDRFLAHKLIGGLAVIALLPVLNLLLVPAPGPPGNEESVSLQSGAADSPARQSGAADSSLRQSGAADSPFRHSGAADSSHRLSGAADSSVRHSGAADSSVRHSGAAEGGTRNLPGEPSTRITAPNEIPDHASGVSGTTGEGGTPATTGEEGASATTGGRGTSATTGEEGASGTSGDGIPGRTDGAATESVPDTQLRLAARRAMTLYGDEPGASGSRPSVDEQLRQMGLETDTERLYRRMMEGQPAPSEVPDRADGASGTTGEGSASATPRHSGAADSSVRGSGAADSSLRGSGAADSSFRHSGAAEGGTRNLPDVPPTRITAPNEIPDHASGVSGTTGEGGVSPTPRHSGAAEGGTRNLPDEPPTRITAPNEIPDHASGVSGTTGEGGVSGTTGEGSASATTGEGGASATTGEEGTPATTGVAGPERLPPLDPGALVLGPMASSPPGQLLAGLKRDLEQGNLAGLMSRFAGRARHDGLRGVDEIAAHYRELFEHLAPRQVDLRARRIARDGDGWRVEADLAIRGYRAGDLVTARDGRVVLRLDQRDGRLQIARLEP